MLLLRLIWVLSSIPESEAIITEMHWISIAFGSTSTDQAELVRWFGISWTRVITISSWIWAAKHRGYCQHHLSSASLLAAEAGRVGNWIVLVFFPLEGELLHAKLSLHIWQKLGVPLLWSHGETGRLRLQQPLKMLIHVIWFCVLYLQVT